MNKDTLRKVALVAGILFIVLAVAVLVFADGPRRWYSGIFFAMVGIVALLGTRRQT